MKDCLRIVAMIVMSQFHAVLLGFNHEEVSAFSMYYMLFLNTFYNFLKYWHFGDF